MDNVRVEIDSVDAGKIVEIELTKNACESIYALCEVFGRDVGTNLAKVLPSIQSAMAEVLRQLPKGFDGIAEVPFTAETAVSVLSLCYFLAKNHPSGPHITWMHPLTDHIGSALTQAQVRCQVFVNDVAVFTA